MIAGTSTGGIIALGLGLGLSAEEIMTFYREDGRRMFPPLPAENWGRFWQFACWMSGPKLRHEELEEALKRRFQGHLLGESRTRLVDGGVWANNPVMVALVDALTAYDLTPEQVEILSIGTGNAPFALSADKVMSGLIAWREAIKAAMFLTTDNATAQAKLLLGPDRCLRLEPRGDDAMIEMDDYDGALARLVPLAAGDFEAARAAITSFFAEEVAPRERHYSAAP